MEIIVPIVFVIFFMLAISMGIQGAIQVLPALFIFGILIYFFGWVVINFFWVFLIIWFVRSLTTPKTTTRRTRYYRTYTGKEAEDFFRQYYQGQNSYNQNYGGYQGQGSYRQGDFTNFGINKDKYYEELGVSKNCTKDELRKAYLKKVKENHPDRFANSTEDEKKYHEEKLKKINEAYDNLVKDFS